ncbi:MAG: hypothetical protein C0P74_008710 [Gammaproteobacteria bacterium]|nr:hypothetical protein [Gammaproteobacteria bacterium]
MTPLIEFFSEYLVPILVLIAVALALTIYIFRRRKFDRGYQKGSAANPRKVRKQNPPDEWSRSH